LPCQSSRGGPVLPAPSLLAWGQVPSALTTSPLSPPSRAGHDPSVLATYPTLANRRPDPVTTCYTSRRLLCLVSGVRSC
jgi:hypothetical protein